MKRYVNYLCVLILALMFFELVWEFFLDPGTSVKPKIDIDSLSLGSLVFLLVVCVAMLGLVVMCFITLVKFVLNVNRNQVFTKKNVSLLRKYGVYVLLFGVGGVILFSYVSIEIRGIVNLIVDTLGEGLFALLMAEVFGIGVQLQEKKG